MRTTTKVKTARAAFWFFIGATVAAFLTGDWYASKCLQLVHEAEKRRSESVRNADIGIPLSR